MFELNARIVSPQDITWFLDLHERGRLDLDPPYQRRSVWSLKDRRFFLNTIFGNLPSPAIFLHRTMQDGRPTYHVVDGKQRLETVIRFSGGEFALGDEFEDRRLDRRKFLELDENLKHQFWNYQFVVEQLTSSEHNYIREIFDRVNRNTKRLTNQEVRHARFDGWFATRVDTEIEADTGVWRQFGVVTPARARRMSDAQFIAELFILIIGGQIIGFDQDIIDTYYAEYEEPSDTRPEFVEDEFEEALGRIKTYLLKVEDFNQVISKHAKTVAHFYSLWALTSLEFARLPPPAVFAERYGRFMTQVDSLTREAVSQQMGGQDTERPPAVLYYLNAQSATTDAGPRNGRHKTLKQAILDDENTEHG